jgi:hypothetical protein
MFKFALKISFLLSIMFSGIAHAGIITNLTQEELDANNFANAEDFLTEDLLNVKFITLGGWDFVWASPVNIQEYEEILTNTLYAPSVQKNWDFAVNHLDALDILINQITITHFINPTDDSIIQGTEYFNSDFHYVNEDDFDQRTYEFTPADADPLTKAFEQQSELFFVRNVADRPDAPNPDEPEAPGLPGAGDPVTVPEPTSLMIFALGLIALSVRVRLAK